MKKYFVFLFTLLASCQVLSDPEVDKDALKLTEDVAEAMVKEELAKKLEKKISDYQFPRP